MVLIGINSVYHDSSASLIGAGEILTFAEEERFNRIKHSKPAQVSNPHELPVHALRYCVENSGLPIGDVDGFCYSFDPDLRRRTFCLDPASAPGDWGSAAGEATFIENLQKVPFQLSVILDHDVSNNFHWVPHHLAHAASAYYPSGYRDAAVLVLDGIGESAGGMILKGMDSRLTVVKELDYPDSLGFLWEKICKFLGFSEYDACKVMGLAAYASGSDLEVPFSRLARSTAEGFQVDPEVAAFRSSGFESLEELFGPRRKSGDPITGRDHALAACLQQFTSEAVLRLARAAQKMVGSRNLCYSGGVALNCVSNWRLKEESVFENVFIPPFPNDAGTAPGAALFVWHHKARQHLIGKPQLCPYLGPEFSPAEVARVLATSGYRYRHEKNVARVAAKLVAEEKVVGWFQGAMEAGPRALGHRSLLANPCSPQARETMNRKVKHRENFRPFGPSVMAERAQDWFCLGRDTECYKYMLVTCPVREAKRTVIPAVVHVDGSSRIQLVFRHLTPKYHRLLEFFERETGVPLVLNTSFNDCEPIVCTPEDALSTFRQTQIDALVIEDFLIERSL